jgi:hypothetical protein
MARIIEHLHLGPCLVRLARVFGHAVDHAAVATFGDLPVVRKIKIGVLVGRDERARFGDALCRYFDLRGASSFKSAVGDFL